MTPFRTLLRYFLGGCLLIAPLAATAQDYPSKPIRMIVPFSAGGPTDGLARSLAKSMGEVLGQSIIVDNRPGAGGSIGIDAVAKAAPDGYVIGMAHTGTTAINPHLYPRHPYDPRSDLTPITPVVSYTNVLVVNPKVPVNNVAEFVAWSKRSDVKANYASGGNGATNHLSGELLKSLTGARLDHIPYKGSAPALVDVMAGTVSAMFDIPITALPQIRAGYVKPLAVTSAKRSSYLPDVPTMRESGVPGFDEAGSDLWFGLVAPAKLPPALVDRLYQAALKAMQMPELQQAIRGMAYEPWTLTPVEFKTFMNVEYEKWAKVVKLSGAKVD
ncbi:Bug family tripartite tricarboxylate transporter substrate binding protein [Hydrogenophaga laconesensis]|uniref:Tripartite-type tricarboxylate transporter receptor subunit TctC n=1 Tax=Hydrogenophaga laconesensis TaxID=1805971 RepID=A0ABU1VJA7_9BURK|nr:tripartite tricarboxylate transporter substrate binding protein [Hydrogenophaga laconesensis]MDR7097566.1 tripartite-type tricarboxylate transporter receptor subunit TctC [Hydrogenophaga laconesensis]